MEIVIADAVRSAVGRGHKGSLSTKRPDELAADVIRHLLERVPQAKGQIDDVILGCAMPDARKEQLVEMLAQRDIPLIEDDIYGDLSFDDPRTRTAKSFDRQGLVLLCDSFSKTLAPGYRVGWVAPGRFQSQIEYLKLVTTVATATLPLPDAFAASASGWRANPDVMGW